MALNDTIVIVGLLTLRALTSILFLLPGKDNVLADTLSRLIDIEPDVIQKPKLQDHKFGKYCFETLPKVMRACSLSENQLVKVLTCM